MLALVVIMLSVPFSFSDAECRGAKLAAQHDLPGKRFSRVLLSFSSLLGLRVGLVVVRQHRLETPSRMLLKLAIKKTSCKFFLRI
jgi:hypothetical protein